MASPDTDELATVPLPAGEPEAGRGPGRSAAQPEAPVAGREVTEVPTVKQERVEPEPAEAAAAAEAAPAGEAAPVGKAAAAGEGQAAPAKVRGRWWRGFTGSLAAGLAVLALGVLVVGAICLYTGVPGPGATLLIGHPVAAVLALLAQRVADRRNGPPAVGAGVAVVLFTVSALTLFWLT
ncbi:hypothetical protein ACWEGE_41465 [Amycolatopsis sp. NPDC004747]